MTVAFMGLTGISGVLPRHYTEYLLERMKAKDLVLRDFFDLFNHRMISLFYRAWEKHSIPVQFEEARYARGKDDRFSKYIFAFLGMGTSGLRSRMGADDDMLLRYAGLLSQRPRSATALRQWLSDYFCVPVSIVQLIGEWLEVGKEDWSRMGTPGVNNRLGISATAGTKVWEQQAGFEIRLGSMAYEKFKSILPSGDDFQALVSMVRFFVGRELSFKIRPLLDASDVPNCRLSTDASCGALLGWTTWLKTKPCTQDADQVIFSGRYRPMNAVRA
jgi:type VI secretion system protein ImpH